MFKIAFILMVSMMIIIIYIIKKNAMNICTNIIKCSLKLMTKKKKNNNKMLAFAYELLCKFTCFFFSLLFVVVAYNKGTKTMEIVY